MVIIEVSPDVFKPWLNLCRQLWPKHELDSLKVECEALVNNPKETAFLLGLDETYVGFINISIRSDRVPGAIHSPVGYIEGIYVRPRYRHRGLAKKLVAHATHWFVAHGCQEMASDAEIDNRVSQGWHEAMGFTKTKVLVHYVKLGEG